MKKDERSQQNYERSGYYAMIFSIFLNVIAMIVIPIIEKGPGLAFFSIITIYVLQMIFWIIMNTLLMKTTLQPISVFWLIGAIVTPLIGTLVFILTSYLSIIIASFIVSGIFTILFFKQQKKSNY